MFVCPLCRLPLAQSPRTWSCAHGHSFDVAREGYVNLLPVQQKKSRAPGDAPDMVAARRDFLDAGHYQPLRDAALALLAPLRAGCVLDIGCGEGYYTRGLPAIACSVIGVDIAQPAIRLAAKRSRDITWLVATVAQLPLADASVALVTSLFSPLPAGEMQRVLQTGGHALVVTPAPEHLLSIRGKLFDEVRPHVPDKFVEALAQRFELQARHELRFALPLAQPALRQLLMMTPYAFKAQPPRRAALEAQDGIDTVAAFTLMLMRRKPLRGAEL